MNQHISRPWAAGPNATRRPSPRIVGLAALLVCMLPFAASAHQDTMAGMDMGPALGASAAFGANHRLWVVTVQGQRVVLQHSDDFGATLSPPTAVNRAPQAIYATSENRPKIAVGPQGQLYVQWTEQSSRGWTGNIEFARSTDGGKVFSTPITINRDRAEITRGFDSLAVASNGDIASLWIDARDHASAEAADHPYRGFAVYSAWSTDGGKTFGPEQKLADHSCECCRTTLARTSKGDVATFFRSVYPGEIRDHSYAVLSPAGVVAAPARATFSGWKVAACPDQGPGLAIGANGTRNAVWYEASHGPAIWYGQLDPGHPARHKMKVAGAGASHADVATSGRNVWIVWNQVNAKGYQLMLRTSTDGGDAFSAPRAIAESAHSVYSPQLLVDHGKAYAAWNTETGFRLIAIPPQVTP